MRLKSDLLLLLAAAIWGSGFVAQRLAAATIGPFYFNGARFLLGALILLPLARLKIPIPRQKLPWAVLTGVLLFAASGFQQAGLATTTIGNASFITGLYVVLIPIILFLVWKKRLTWISWLAVLLASVGVALLSLQGELHFATGDLLELGGALVWALHVILVGKLASEGIDILGFAIVQFAVSGVLGLVTGVALNPAGILAYSVTWPALLYSAVFPVAVAFTLQAVGQKMAPPTDAAIIMSMEAVFGTLFAFLFLHEMLSVQQIIGCVMMLAAMLLAQANPGKEVALEASPEPEP